MNIILRIKRYKPEISEEHKFQDFSIDAEPTSRVLDALMYIKRDIDGTLCFRKSCAHGICGSDAMTINGIERLACKTLIQDVAEKDGDIITLEPLRSLPVQRDLMIDYSRFFKTYRIVKPFLIPIKKQPETWSEHSAEDADKMPALRENIQTPEQRKKIDDPTNCILCASCYAACPVITEKDPEFIGPAAVLQAARFVFDSRDEGIEPRLEVLDGPHGAWPCENHLKCTEVCPRGIKVTRNINLIKRSIKKFKEQGN
jgi:succinate dehydrogenase / fumarate reductase iron-sulfur subunit